MAYVGDELPKPFSNLTEKSEEIAIFRFIVNQIDHSAG